MVAGKLEFKLHTASDGDTVVMLSGVVDERADFSGLSIGSSKRVRFDLAGISRMNSIGIMAWARFFQTLPKTVSLVVERCSIEVIEHLNMMPGLFGGHSVEMRSFYAPYRCDPCDYADEILLVTAKHFSSNDVSSPRLRCDKCSLPMTFDGYAIKHFLFLGRQDMNRSA